MKRNNRYHLEKLADVPYLLPYGQTQADILRGMRLNETGEYLWNRLSQECNEEELICDCAAHYEMPEADKDHLREDIRQFLKELTDRGMLNDSEAPLPCALSSLPEAGYVSIAGLHLRLRGPADAFPEQFDPFRTQTQATVHQTIFLCPSAPSHHLNGQVILRHRDLVVIDSGSLYILLFPAAPQIFEAHLSKDAAQVVFYCAPPFSASFHEDLFHAIRLVFLYLAQRHDRIALHSASLLYREKIWLFSGPSGTGKSTHTNLWHRLLKSPLINGDLNLIAPREQASTVLGIPWCGTSGIFDNASHPLGGIILLKQSPDDHVEELSRDRQILSVQQRLISPAWTSEMLRHNLTLVERLTSHILICKLHCTIKDTAVTVIKDRIDQFLN
ncbi:MAG: PqqD family peptide modification chaperone [Candidatus Gastranaerophilales bacterium]|nr:PqqD family peptide modification chaperone [Candidatus Gastranaerophilales bacterium]